MLVGEKLHKCVKPEDVARILADEGNDIVDMPRSDLFDPPAEDGAAEPATADVPADDGDGGADGDGAG